MHNYPLIQFRVTGRLHSQGERWGTPLDRSNAQRQRNIHTHIDTYDQFSKKAVDLTCQEQARVPGEINTCTERTCKPHAERPNQASGFKCRSLLL